MDSSKLNLSNGEIQTVVLIRSLILNPDVYIFDEPENSFDREMKEKLISLFSELGKSKIVILITHNNEFKNLGRGIIDVDKYSN